MNQLEFWKKIQQLDFPPDEYYILGNGALLLYGIKSNVYDIGLCVTEEFFSRLVRDGKIDIKSKNKKTGFYKLENDPQVNIFVDLKTNFKCTKVGDLFLEDINHILEVKQKRNNKSDKKNIEKISAFIQNINRRW